MGIHSRYNKFSEDISFDFARQNAGLEDQALNKLNIDHIDFTNQIYFETTFKQVFSFGIGAEHKYLKIKSETLDRSSSEIPDNIFENSHFLSGFGNLRYDSYDNKYFPSTGFYLNSDFHLYLYSSDYNENFSEFSIAKGVMGYALMPLDKLSLRLETSAGLKIGNDNTNTLDFFLGGYGNNLVNNFEPFLGYDFINISGDSYIKALLELDYEFIRRHHLVGSANYANVGNRLYSTGEWFSSPNFSGYAIGYGLESFIGPLEVKYTWSPELQSSTWFFSLGFWF